MEEKSRDRRQFQRLIFSVDNEIYSTIHIVGTRSEPIRALILNISPGGVSFSITGRDRKIVKKGDKIILKEIQERNKTIQPINVYAEIIWRFEDPTTEYIGIGAKFFDMTESHKLELNRFIQMWQKRGK